MIKYRYYLEQSSKKFRCPDCNRKCFVRYIDSQAKEYLPEGYGRCDREIKCGYHLNPYHDGYNQLTWKQDQVGYTNNPDTSRQKANLVQGLTHAPKPVSSIPLDILKATRKDYEHNVFIQNLLKRLPYPFEASDVMKAISLYHLGTNSDYLPGMVTFPFIDTHYNIRAIQVKQFDRTNHTTHTNFLHSILKFQYERKNEPLPEWLHSYLQNEKKVTCLFGEHLLNEYPANPVALVEAPKTAIIATLCCGFPDAKPANLIWLGVYNLSSLNVEKCSVLKGREVALFPDLNALSEWNRREKELSRAIDANFKVSDWLEKRATDEEKGKGLDLADYLIQYDYKAFRSPIPKPVVTNIADKAIN